MKIQCDVCEKEQASVFCSADEAALCHPCDRRVHHANKLAGKHLRFSLLSPSSKDSPLCDICQERSAFLFCQEDRAILCRECDIPIHRANEHTQKHNRFLLPGVKLSAASSPYYQTSSSSHGSYVGTTETEPDIKSSVSKSTPNCEVEDHCTSQEGASVSTSSISEYLMETLPGWHVEDFLDPTSSPYGFCKGYNHMLPFHDHESNLGCFSSEYLGIRVPQAPSQSYHLPQTEEVNSMMKLRSEDGFKVPPISPPYVNKSRQFWQRSL